MSPRYDLPKAAPEPLRRVQLFLNSTDLSHGVDWLPDWLAERGLEAEHDRALELREALRRLVQANGGAPVDPAAIEIVNRSAGRLSVRLGSGARPEVANGGDELDGIVATALGAMLDGSWERLKACRNCRWSFFDYSPNRSATWCSMQICGNRAKTRAYRRRRRAS